MEKVVGPNFDKNNQKDLVSFEKSKELATQLLERHKSEIQANFQKDVDGWGDPYTDYQESIRHYLDGVPEEILEHYQGHGITRNSGIDQLAGALNILANKSIKGECGKLGGETYGYGAYGRGDFLVVSNFDKGLPITKEKEGRQAPVFDDVGWQADIGAFIVDTHYYPLVDELKELFPDVNIIKANEIPSLLKGRQ